MRYQVFVLLLLLFCISCSDENKTDEELLKRDKKELQESLDSFKTLPYKFCKILLRSSAEKDTISPEFKAFKGELDKVNQLLKYDIKDPDNLSLSDYVALYRVYTETKSFVRKTDEDIFPTVTDALHVLHSDSTTKQTYVCSTGEKKIFVENMEHAVLSAIAILSKDLGKEVALYECMKTQPEVLPDSEIKTLLRYFRGFLFFEKGLYYSSEEEISGNIDWLNENPDIDFELTRSIFGWPTFTNSLTHTGFHAFNHLFRGFDRLMMDRSIDEERALEDFEIFLTDSKKIGLDNEIIWAIETYLYLKHEKHDEAIVALAKLKTSPLLSSRERKTIDQSIIYLNNREADKIANSVYDRYFLSKIATKYMIAILAQVDWEQVLKDQNVPHTEEMFATIENFQQHINRLNKYASVDNLKDAGEGIKEKGKAFWDRVRELEE